MLSMRTDTSAHMLTPAASAFFRFGKQRVRKDQVFLAERALRLINVLLAFMISAYSSMFIA